MSATARVRRVLVRTVVAVGLATTSVSAQPSPTAILDGLRANAARPIDFHAAVYPDTVFVGQQVTYQVAVLLSDVARSRLRRNPEFLPPELRGLLAYELGTPRRAAPRSFGAGVFEAHVFQRALFAVKPGTVAVPAPQLSYSLPQSASYFSREESFVVRAESASVAVRPLPDSGRPAGFTGAVGVLRASARLDAAAARVGDPLVLTMRLEGTGNVKLLPRPTLELSWASVVPGSERVQVDSTGPLVRGSKEFDFLLTPTQPGPSVLPVFRYSYFDPYRREYAWAETSPDDVVVAAGSLGVAVEGEEPTFLPLRTWRQQERRPVVAWPHPWRWALLALWLLAPLPAFVALWRRQRRRTVARGGEEILARKHHGDAVHDATPAGGARRVRRSLLEQLALRLEVPVLELMSRREVEQTLRRRGVTRDTTRDVLALLDDLAVRGFGAPDHALHAAQGDPLTTRSASLVDRVHAEAVARGRTSRWARRRRPLGSGTLGACLLLGTLLSALVSNGAIAAQSSTSAPVLVSTPTADERAVSSAELIREATAAYDARRFQHAAEVFSDAAARRPLDADVLTNWGTAAFAASDTVSAVIAWQRAARLEPFAADVQAHVLALPAGARGGFADVPMVPVSLLALAGTALWLVGWGLLASAWRTKYAEDDNTAGAMPFRAVGVVVLCVAVAAAGSAWWGTRALDLERLAVVRRPETLRVSPGYDAATMGGAATGDMVRVDALEEGWGRVMLTDGRQGWLPASRLAPLDSRAVAR